ncbi:MAG: OB-fold domain-containing protein [Deltaproteobacteria bacterium]|nr:OB-fold domain-containing protein [Deltaproteobacteria bacterium]
MAEPSTDADYSLPLLPAGIARQQGAALPVLLGGHCPACGRTFFPRPQYCPGCLAPPEVRELSGEGTIYSYTVVRIRPPFGLPQPYAVGYVDLAGTELRIYGMFDPADTEDLAIGRRVRLSVGPLGADLRGAPCLRPFFSLRGEERDHG